MRTLIGMCKSAVRSGPSLCTLLNWFELRFVFLSLTLKMSEIGYVSRFKSRNVPHLIL